VTASDFNQLRHDIADRLRRTISCLQVAQDLTLNRW